MTVTLSLLSLNMNWVPDDCYSFLTVTQHEFDSCWATVRKESQSTGTQLMLSDSKERVTVIWYPIHVERVPDDCYSFLTVTQHEWGTRWLLLFPYCRSTWIGYQMTVTLSLLSLNMNWVQQSSGTEFMLSDSKERVTVIWYPIHVEWQEGKSNSHLVPNSCWATVRKE
jgi:hypothetical protein